MPDKKYSFLLGAACMAAGVAIGALLMRSDPVVLHATATQGHDNFVIATGLVDERVEAFFFLDFLTGDLKATVVNDRRPGFNAAYEYNIAADFDMGAVKNPKFLMVTGAARGRTTGGAAGRLSESVLYVVEATSGRLVAYSLPWNQSLYASGKPQRGTFIKIGQLALRNQIIRDQ